MAEYKNPNQQGGKQDTSSLLVFTVVFAAILLGMQFFKPKHPATPGPAQTTASKTNTSQQNGAAAAAANNAPNATVTPTGDEATGVSTPKVTAASQTTTVVENELYRITFSNRGGEVTSWILKKYTNYDGKPLDLVHPTAAEKFGYPLAIYTYDAALRKRLAQALYVPSATGTLTAPNQLTFEYSAGGLVVRKTFHFDDSYVVTADVSVTQNGAPVEALVAWPAGFGDQREARDYSTYQKIDRSSGGKVESVAPKKVNDGETQSGSLDWGGVSDLYFAAMFLPETPANSTFVTLRQTLDIPKNPDEPKTSETEPEPVLGAAVGAVNGPTTVRIFAGPKSLGVLSSIRAMGPDGKANGPNLVPIVHYGMWSFIAQPLFYLLRWVYDHVVHNWGWAILILTVFLTLAMFPTRFTMMKSSIKMQRIQPQMNFIKEKYKKYKFDDPRKQDMNREMQELYKKEGVNMFGGCLPMLVQFPLIFAFYAMLENAIELRHAHWFWLHDLSAPDPYHILPILMVASQFLYQLYLPQPGVDAAQQKMMAFTMPLFSGFICWHYASGLALYWSGSNLIGIGQQMIINRTKLGKELREIQAKRALKKKGWTTGCTYPALTNLQKRDYGIPMPIENYQSAVETIDAFLKLVVGKGGLRLKYRITAGVGAADPHKFESREIYVEIAGPDVDLVLEHNAELLRSLEHIAAKTLRLEPFEHDLVSFDARGYKALRAQELKLAADTAAEQVRRTSEPYQFAPMNSRERRMLHLALKNYEDLRSESSGEGMRRSVVVYPKNWQPRAPSTSGTGRARTFGRS